MKQLHIVHTMISMDKRVIIMTLVILCLKVFFARILDVSLGTVRTMVTVKGNRLIASVVGFVEILVWFVIVKEVLNTDENSLWLGISYAGGFATGTYLGAFISENILQVTLVSK